MDNKAIRFKFNFSIPKFSENYSALKYEIKYACCNLKKKKIKIKPMTKLVIINKI